MKFNSLVEELVNEKTLYNNNKKSGDVKYKVKVTGDGDNKYIDVEVSAPKKDLPIRMNWVTEIKAIGEKDAMRSIDAQTKELEKAKKVLEKSLEIMNKRISDLGEAKSGLISELDLASRH